MTTLPTGRAAEGVHIDSEASHGTGIDHALERLYDEHYLRLVRLSVLLVGDRGRAEEIVQDSFVAVYQRMRKLGDPGFALDSPAYLRQTVVNRSRSALRHLMVVSRHPDEAPRPVQGADHEVLARARRARVIQALATLPRRQREVIALRYYLDLSEREIADTLGISPGAVKSHASRGAAALRQNLSPLLEES